MDVHPFISMALPHRLGQKSHDPQIKQQPLEGISSTCIIIGRQKCIWARGLEVERLFACEDAEDFEPASELGMDGTETHTFLR